MSEVEEKLDRDWNEGQRAFRAARGLSAKPSASKKAGTLNLDKPLWHRQPREGLAAYEAFMVFLAMGKERTAFKVAEAQGVSKPYVNKLQSRWSWSYRVGSYEEHYMLLRLEDMESKRDDMWSSQEALAMTALALVGSQFDSMLDVVRLALEEGEAVEVMRPDALVRLFDTASKIQRMAVLGKDSNLAEVREREEALAEAHSQELAELIDAVMNDLELNPVQQEKARDVLKAKLVG